MGSIGQQLVQGAGWMVLLRVTDRLVGILSFTVLARLLLPEHFGLVALATSVIALAEMFSELGVELALIRDPQSGQGLYNAAWTLKIGRGLIMGAVYAVLAQPAATFFNEPRLEVVIYCLALAGLIDTWENIGVVEFRKSLAFEKEFKYLFLSRCLPVPLTLGLAYTWRSYAALLAGIITQRVIKVLLSYGMHPYRPRFSLNGVRHLLDFTKWMAVQNLVQGLSQRAPAFVLGRLTNVTILGHFEIALELATLATSELRAPIRKVLLPGFVQYASDIARLRQGVLDTYGMLVLISLPIPVVMVVLAPLLVQVFLGEHWRSAVPVVQVLAVYGMVQSLGTSGHLVYLALNRLRLMTILSGLSFSVLVPLLLWGVSRWEAVGAGWAMTITATLILCVDVSLVGRVLGVRTWEFFRLAARPLLAACGMGWVLWRLSIDAAVPMSFHSGLLYFLVFILMGLTTYIGLLVIFWRLCGRPQSAERQLVSLITEQWRTWRRQAILPSPNTPLLVQKSSRSIPPALVGTSAPEAPAVIMFGVNEWNELWQTRQHIASRLAQRGWSVVYSTSQPYFSLPRGTPEWRALPWKTTQRQQDKVTVVTAGRLRSRYARLPTWERYVLRQHAQDLRNAMNGQEKSQSILYISHPMFWPYVEHVPHSLLIYHADDAFSLMPEWTTALTVMEAKLVARADLVLASSHVIARLLPDDGPHKARILPNAVEAPVYLQARNEPCPADLQAIPHPRIGFTGAINFKVDLCLIARLARERPDWHWVLVGASAANFATTYPAARYYIEGLAACRNLSNVHLLGPKPIWQVARYMAHMDVNTLCYRHEPGHWWTAIYPLKLHEYLAVGHPVVATDLETIRPFSSVLAIARSPQEWLEAIATALHSGGVGSIPKRQAVALANTWEGRIDQLADWIEEVRKSRHLTGFM